MAQPSPENEGYCVLHVKQQKTEQSCKAPMSTRKNTNRKKVPKLYLKQQPQQKTENHTKKNINR